jgi:hypothetical protein
LHAEERDAAALEHTPHLAGVTHARMLSRTAINGTNGFSGEDAKGNAFTSLTESNASLSLRWSSGEFIITASAKLLGTSEECIT